MNDKSIERIIGYGAIAVIGYFVVGALLPYLIVGVIALLILRFYRHQK